MTKKKDNKYNYNNKWWKESSTAEHNKYYYEKGRNGWTPTTAVVFDDRDGVPTMRDITPDDVNSKERKEKPVFTGVLKYFPDAIMEIANCSYVGQKQHNPDLPLAWDRSKSGDELDALARHLIDAGTFDSDGVRHSAKVAWRALANLQKELEENGDGK